jgi:hypothetical protein
VPATAFGLEGALALGARLVNVTDAAAVLTAGLRDRLSGARQALDAAR